MRRATHAAAVAVLLASCGPIAAARADDASCADVRIVVNGLRGGAAPSKLIEAIFAEVSSHTSAPCGGEQGRPIASIAVEWDAGRTARVRIDLSDRGDHHVTMREIDLTRIAQDSVPLALAIAADELLQEARARVAGGATAESPALPSLASSRREGPSPLARTSAPRWTFGSGVGAEWFSSATVLAGPDATLDWSIERSFTLSMHVGLRAAMGDLQANERLALASAGSWLRLGLTGDARGGTGVSAGLDVLALATPAGSLRATLVPGAALSGWYALARGWRMGADAGGGLALARLAMADGAVVGGGELRSRVSLLVDF